MNTKGPRAVFLKLWIMSQFQVGREDGMPEGGKTVLLEKDPTAFCFDF